MSALADRALERLQRALREPDLTGTRYRLCGLLGRGGMGSVYEVEDTQLQRRLALKILDVPGAELESRLQREAEVLATLEHPGVVPVHEVGTLPDGRPYYAMKRVQGTRLDRAAVRTGTLAERLRVFLRVAETVAFAHAHGILHRDLKPENVMLGPFGEVLVLDWGLARRLSGGEPAVTEGPNIGPEHGDTGSGAILGTPGYMAPELAAGTPRRVDHRVDVYSLGVLLRFLLGTPGSTAAPAPPLAAVVARATAEVPDQRYPDVPALVTDVERFIAGEAVSAYPERPWTVAARIARRHRVALLLVVAYLAARALLFLFARP